MLRDLLTQLMRKGLSRPAQRTSTDPGDNAGAIAFVVNADATVRVDAGARLYSDLASVRLRSLGLASRLAESRPVYLVPSRLLAEGREPAELQSAATVIVAKFSTADLLAYQERFEALLGWLSRSRDRFRLVADLSDNYAAIGDATNQPFLGRYQAGLGENCMITVPCEALREDLSPFAKHGIHVIEDPYESPRVRPARGTAGEPVRLCWFGQLGKAKAGTIAQGLSRAVSGLGGRPAALQFVTHETRRDMAAEIIAGLGREHPGLSAEFVPWSVDATWRAIDCCDLVILPQDHNEPRGRAKSHNRLVESIRGGRFAIASPIPSYCELAEYCWVGEDLASGVEWALSHADEATARIRAGQAHVADRFSPARFINQWERLIAPEDKAASQSGSSRDAATNTAVRLNLGCGDKILPGYVNVDVAASRAGRSPDVLCDLHELTPFDTASADEVLAVHVVEHFWRWEVVDILREWARVLKPGGRMILECPNLLSACEELLRNPDIGAGPGREGQRTMWVFYGDPAWKDPLMCHRWNYTPQSLSAIMADAGLVNIRQEPAQFKLREPRDMRIVGEMPRRTG